MKCKFIKRECDKECENYDTCTAKPKAKRSEPKKNQEERPDCFAYKNPEECDILNVKKCEGCRFYKTKEEYEHGR